MAHAGTSGRFIPAQPVPDQPKSRFEILDSWRGICALLVAMMHFPVSGWLAESPVVRGGYLFVDYFFVLSGAVIAHGYGHRIASGGDYGRFMLLRLGRIYPLHLAVLLLFVAFEALRWMVPALRGDGIGPFTDGNSLPALVSSLLLLNGTGLESQLVWNGPSWSISSEVWTYVLFGALVLVLRDRLWLALIPAVLVSPVVLAVGSSDFMDTTYALGLVRCVYGFSLGALLYGLFRSRPAALTALAQRSGAFWTVLELLVVAIVGLFVSLAADNAWSFTAPFVFGLALLVFIHERGLISRFLRMRPFLWLGTLSYGIYMFHIFVQSRMINAATLVEKFTGLELIRPFEVAGKTFVGFGLNGPLFGTAMMAVMVLAVVMAAWIGNVLVEKPFQRLTKDLLGVGGARPGDAARRYAQAISRPAARSSMDVPLPNKAGG